MICHWRHVSLPGRFFFSIEIGRSGDPGTPIESPSPKDHQCHHLDGFDAGLALLRQGMPRGVGVGKVINKWKGGGVWKYLLESWWVCCCLVFGPFFVVVVVSHNKKNLWQKVGYFFWVWRHPYEQFRR